MKVQCQNCQTMLSIPDDRLTPGTEFSFNCPKCKQKNNVHVPAPDEKPPVAEAPAPVASPTPPEPTQGPPPEPGPEDEDEQAAPMDFFEEGAKPVLICFDPGPLQSRIAKIMTDLGYVPVLPKSTRDALQRLRLTQFPAVLVHEEYDGQTLETNQIWRFIQPMDMTTRRRMFVALFGRNMRSMDNMTAYALSVNAVVNVTEEANLAKIIRRALAEYERFYKVYFDVMRELGKL